MSDIETECIRRIAEAKGLNPEEVGLDTTLDSLAVDSLDRVSLSFDLEEQYGIEIPESKLNTIRTVADIAHAVKESLLAKGEGGNGDSKAGPV